MGDQPVHAIESERVIISAMVIEGAGCPLAPETFYGRAERAAYAAAKALLGRSLVPDLPTLTIELRERGKLDEVGGPAGLAMMVNATLATSQLEQHIQKVRECAVRRKAGLNGKALAGLAGEPSVPITQTLAEHADVIEQLQEQAAPSTKRPLLELVPGSSIFAPLPPVAWLVEGLDICPGPPVLVAGYGYSAKTVAWQAAALAVCSGEPVWGAYRCRQGRVVHLDYEQGTRLTAERYQRLLWGMQLGRGVGDSLSLACLPHLYLDAAPAEDELCRACEGASLLLVDSFRAACPSIEENSSDARRPLDMLARVSERTGVVAVVLHHARKPQRDSLGGARMAIRGSGALYDGCASCLVHEADSAQDPVRVCHEKARTSGRLADPFLLRVTDVPDGHDDRAGLLVTAEAAPADDARAAAKARGKLDAVMTLVRDLFRSEPVQTSPDHIAAKLGRSKGDVRAAIGLLLEAGEVEATGKTRDRKLTWTGR